MTFFNRNIKLTPTEILEVIDPDNTGRIDLEDIKTILSKFSGPVSSKIQQICKDYILAFKSFSMPNSYFINKFSDIFDNTSHLRTGSYDLSGSENSRSRPIKPSNRPDKQSYSQIYNHKKALQKKIFNDSIKLFDRIDRKKESCHYREKIQKENIHEIFSQDDLLKIRKLHLRQASIY